MSWWDEPVDIDSEVQTPAAWLERVWTELTDVDIAAALSRATGRDVTHYAVCAQRRRRKLNKTRTGVPRIFAESGQPRYDQPPIIEADDVLVMADIHAPFHNADWCSDVVTLAVRLGIKRVIAAGDLLDFASITSFTKQMLAQGESDLLFSDELEAAAEFVGVLLENFDLVDCILGNHEERLTRRMAVRMRARVIAQLLGFQHEKRLTIHPYFYCIVETSMSKWRVTHPRNISVVSGRVAASLADKYRMNVVAGHLHNWAERTSASGYYAAECGCCADPQRFAHLALRDNIRPRMQAGAWLLHQGRPVLLHPEYRPPGAVGG